jgi:GxxExxY protein
MERLVDPHTNLMLFEELTGQILGSCFEVSKELGTGFAESVYGNALKVVFDEKGIPNSPQAPMSVLFRGKEIGHFYADFLVEEKVIVELKAIDAIRSEHKAQVINYLKVSGVKVGLLVNFGKAKLEYYRLFL